MLRPGPVPIGIVIPAFEPGGTERQMIEVARRLDRSRWTVHVACFHAQGRWLGRVAERAASVTAFPIRGFWRPQVVPAMQAFAAWCRRERIAVVHTSELYSNIFALPAAAMAGVPVRIGSRREIAARKTCGQIALQRLAYSCAHRVVANAGAAAERLRREGVSAAKVVVVPNGLDITQFQTPRSPQRSHRVVMVANLRPEKGHDTLIEAVSDVLARFPDLRVELIGDGTERARLIAMTRERGVAHAFSFHGHCEDVPARLANADLFVLPSRSEAFPNAVLEAMAAGLPVVATSVGGILEIVEDGRTGLLTPPGDARALADRLCRLLADRALAARLGSAGRALVESRYSFDRMVAALDHLYDTELTRRGARAVARWERAAL